MEEKILDLIEVALECELDTRELKACNSKNIDNWDSLNIMNLVVMLEDEFQIQLSDEEINLIMESGENILSILKEKGM